MKKKKSTPAFQAQGSPLLESLRLAMIKQGKRKFSGVSDDENVRIRLNGQHKIESIEIKNSGLSKKKEEALLLALRQAFDGAVDKAKRAAKKDIVAGTKGSVRGKKAENKNRQTKKESKKA